MLNVDFQGQQNDDDYDTATRGCTNQSCVQTDIEYANGYFTRYDIISRGLDGYIPGMISAYDWCKQKL